MLYLNKWASLASRLYPCRKCLANLQKVGYCLADLETISKYRQSTVSICDRLNLSPLSPYPLTEGGGTDVSGLRVRLFFDLPFLHTDLILR